MGLDKTEREGREWRRFSGSFLKKDASGEDQTPKETKALPTKKQSTWGDRLGGFSSDEDEDDGAFFCQHRQAGSAAPKRSASAFIDRILCFEEPREQQARNGKVSRFEELLKPETQWICAPSKRFSSCDEKVGAKGERALAAKMEEYRKSPQLKPQRSSGRYDGRDNTADQWRRPSSGGAARTSSAASPGSAPSSSVSTSSSAGAPTRRPLKLAPRTIKPETKRERTSSASSASSDQKQQQPPQSKWSRGVKLQSGDAKRAVQAVPQAYAICRLVRAREKMASSKERKLWDPSSTTGADKDSAAATAPRQAIIKGPIFFEGKR